MKKLSLNKFADELMQTMPLMFREFARREDNALVRGKISCPQMLAMNFASERSEVTVGEIARVLSSEKSSVSVLLERLVREKKATEARKEGAGGSGFGFALGSGMFGQGPGLRTFVEKRTASVAAQLAGERKGWVPSGKFGAPGDGPGIDLGGLGARFMIFRD